MSQWNPDDYHQHSSQQQKWARGIQPNSLEEASLRTTRLELVPKDMTHEGRKGLEGWLRTTWTPYSQRLSRISTAVP